MKQKLFSIALTFFAVHAMGQTQEAFEFNNHMNVAPIAIMEQTDTTKNEVVLTEKTTTENNEVFATVEKQPEYPGGMAELMKFLSSNIQYPTACKKKGIQGKVVVQFVVDTDGSITDVQVIRKVDPRLDEEAIRVIKAMPKWIPGMNGGKNVRVRFTLPVNFNLKNGNK